MTDERQLIEALREAGHLDLADGLRRKRLASELADVGRADLAEALDQPAPAQEEHETLEQHQTSEQRQGRSILDAIDKGRGGASMRVSM